jgi:hypothetical protein
MRWRDDRDENKWNWSQAHSKWPEIVMSVVNAGTPLAGAWAHVRDESKYSHTWEADRAGIEANSTKYQHKHCTNGGRVEKAHTTDTLRLEMSNIYTWESVENETYLNQENRWNCHDHVDDRDTYGTCSVNSIKLLSITAVMQQKAHPEIHRAQDLVATLKESHYCNKELKRHEAATSVYREWLVYLHWHLDWI